MLIMSLRAFITREGVAAEIENNVGSANSSSNPRSHLCLSCITLVDHDARRNLCLWKEPRQSFCAPSETFHINHVPFHFYRLRTVLDIKWLNVPNAFSVL